MHTLTKTLTILCLSAALLSGCGPGQTTSQPPTEQINVTYNDQTYTLPHRPQRIIPLAPDLLNMLYAVGGTAAGRPTTKNDIDPQAKHVPEIGLVFNVDTEKIISLQPDLVIGLTEQNSKIKPILESNHIPFMLLNYNGIEDNVPLLKALGTITGHEDKAAQEIAKYEAAINQAKALMEGKPPIKIAILWASGNAIMAETSSAVAANIAKEAGFDNVLLHHDNMNTDTKLVPYSLETLAEDNPDVTFMVTMGKDASIKKRIDEDLGQNPAWQQMKAVQTGKVIYLPPDLFLMNPGLRTPEAMKMLIEKAYAN